MKKTLIALAVAASAAVSGSAMAWTANGTGGNVDLGGTLTPTTKVTPWEVKTGAAVTDLDAPIQKGQKEVSIVTHKAIPVLGVRTIESVGFVGGQQGISPQITYNDHVAISKLKLGETVLTLEAKDENDSKIGVMTAPYSVAGIMSWHGQSGSNAGKGENVGLYAGNAGKAFFGGVGTNASSTLNYVDSMNKIKKIDATVLEHFVVEAKNNEYSADTKFEDSYSTYSGAYAGGIESGKIIKLVLDQAAGDAPIKWKASLPVTVSYQ